MRAAIAAQQRLRADFDILAQHGVIMRCSPEMQEKGEGICHHFRRVAVGYCLWRLWRDGQDIVKIVPDFMTQDAQRAIPWGVGGGRHAHKNDMLPPIINPAARTAAPDICRCAFKKVTGGLFAGQIVVVPCIGPNGHNGQLAKKARCFGL